MAIDTDEVRAVFAESDLLRSEQQVSQAFDRMATEITAALGDANPVVLCVMTGGIIPVGQLLVRIVFPLQLDYLHVTRYRGDTRGGELSWRATHETSLEGRTVLVVDDILDEGITLASIAAHCRSKGASKVYTAVLVDKVHNRRAEGISADFVGMRIEDRYVFGVGMDYQGYLRNLPAIYAVRKDRE